MIGPGNIMSQTLSAAMFESERSVRTVGLLKGRLLFESALHSLPTISMRELSNFIRTVNPANRLNSFLNSIAFRFGIMRYHCRRRGFGPRGLARKSAQQFSAIPFAFVHAQPHAFRIRSS